MITPVHRGKVEKGRLIFFDPELLNRHTACLEGKHVTVIIKKATKVRSIPQNSRHWARMIYYAHCLGDRTPEELHDDFKAYFLTDRASKIPRIKSSTELTTAEFSQWEEDIDRIMGEMGIKPPDLDNLEIEK